MLKVSILKVMNQVVTFCVGSGDGNWTCTAIYASPILTGRSNLWCYLVDLCNRISHPWVWVSDFNKVLYEMEVSVTSEKFYHI